MTWRIGTVISTGKAWRGARELEVTLDRPLPGHPEDDPEDGGAPATVRALAYTDLVGDPAPGDALLLNVSALARGLGTGGYALVVGPASPGTTLPPDPAPGPGHLVKARYTPLQTMVLGVDEQESPHHATLADADDLHGMPVVVADLHSALPAVVAGLRHAPGGDTLKIAYVMTDGGALPAAFSRTVAALRDAGWLHTCVTVGQAYGGDLEAVTVHTGLLAARHVAGCDVAVVAQGPGNLGTGTRWGYSGVAAGEAVNAAATLHGRPVASLRVSGADPRDRHLGISHHSLTAYTRVALAPADIPVPAPTPDVENLPAWGPTLTTRLHQQTTALATAGHTLVDVPADPTLLDTLRTSPAGLRTMGRGLDADPASFVTAAVAGLHAHHLTTQPTTPTA
ncbi:Protein of unknown function (DUF3866) [Promicromonospora thailandica]|uniref:DUF3866 family protein n=2 Tax=Promicromonospora thailandica TaxID=765201 RepID=A0A9X2G4U3_9MICO|nr:Protein of unknown function (DUF3866) [Promicromonospora thailandica]